MRGRRMGFIVSAPTDRNATAIRHGRGGDRLGDLEAMQRVLGRPLRRRLAGQAIQPPVVLMPRRGSSSPSAGASQASPRPFAQRASRPRSLLSQIVPSLP